MSLQQFVAHYRIVSKLGEGGMGAVYRAADTKLNRDVAIKVLPEAVAQDSSRMRRFEREAQVLASLNHPNIAAIYGIEQAAIVMELVEGQSPVGPLPASTVIDYARQIASGLEAAHEKGIVHRDLKPANIKVTPEGVVKLLDFGLAKAAEEGPSGAPGVSPTVFPTISLEATQAGMILGTAAYMSPEQARGKPVDRRADIWAFGIILYELLTGRHPLGLTENLPDILAAVILSEPDLSALAPDTPPHLRRLIERCLRKDPKQRLRDIGDARLALEEPDAAAPAAIQRKRNWRPLAYVAVAALLCAAAYLAGSRANSAPTPRFQRLTFQRGNIYSARFAPEGKTVVYTASWEGRPFELFTTRVDSRESRALGIQNAIIASISTTGEMALLMCKDRDVYECQYTQTFTLARAPLAGGAPREILENVSSAAWSPDGSELAVLRLVGGKNRIEFPIGHVLYETEGDIPILDLSFDGETIAFPETPGGGSDISVSTVNRRRERRVFSQGWRSQGFNLLWASSQELWVQAQTGGMPSREMYAVGLSGTRRLVTRMPAPFYLADVAASGSALILPGAYRVGLAGTPPGESRERDFSFLDGSELDDISHDTKTLLINEFLDGGGGLQFSVFLRRIGESTPVRLGEGQACAFSPDGTRVLTIRQSAPQRVVILPVGAGEPLVLDTPGVDSFYNADWLPGGAEIVYAGASSEPGHPRHLYRQDLAGGKPRPIASIGGGNYFAIRLASPDGKTAWSFGKDGRPMFFPLDGTAPTPIPGMQVGDHPAHWSADGKSYYFIRPRAARAQIMKVELGTGRISLWKEIGPADPAGVYDLYGLHIADDDKSYFYSYVRGVNDLYLMEGMK